MPPPPDKPEAQQSGEFSESQDTASTRANPEDFQALILCAGLGTRLRPLSLELPKPAVPLLFHSLIAYPMALLAQAGFRQVSINSHWLPQEMRRAATLEAESLGLSLRISEEQPEALETAGALRQAVESGVLDGERPVLVLNGDVLFDVDLGRVLSAHQNTGAAATLVLRQMPKGASYRAVEVDKAQRIHRIADQGAPSLPSRERCLFSGVHILAREALSLIPPGPQSIVDTAWASLLQAGSHLQAVFDESTWLDLGDPQGYLAAHLALLDGELKLDRLREAGFDFPEKLALHPSAEIGKGSQIQRSVVGEKAFIGAGAKLVDCVVWPNARVEAGEELSRCIVTPNRRVIVSI